MELYSREQAMALGARIRRWIIVASVAGILGLTGCIVCCCLSGTATASKMETRAILISLFTGWFVIFAMTVRILPDRYALQHEQNVLESPRTTVTGPITLEPEVLQIPRSIAICKVVVGSGLNAQRLSIRADKARLLAGMDGRCLNLQITYGYIAAFEEAHENH